jgi:hypothetical protein
MCGQSLKYNGVTSPGGFQNGPISVMVYGRQARYTCSKRSERTRTEGSKRVMEETLYFRCEYGRHYRQIEAEKYRSYADLKEKLMAVSTVVRAQIEGDSLLLCDICFTSLHQISKIEYEQAIQRHIVHKALEAPHEPYIILDRRWFTPVGSFIGIVAVQTFEQQWKAYIGVAAGEDTKIDEQRIASLGAGLSAQEAHGIFPQLDIEQYKMD